MSHYEEFLQFLSVNYKPSIIQKRFDYLKKQLHKCSTKTGDSIVFAQLLDECSGHYYSAIQLSRATNNIYEKYLVAYEHDVNVLEAKIEAKLEQKKRNKEISTLSDSRIKRHLLSDPETADEIMKLNNIKIELKSRKDLCDGLARAWERKCKSLERLAGITNFFIIGKS